MTLNPVCENVETAQGVPLTVTGGTGENYEEPRIASHGKRTVPRQKGARNQVHGSANARGPLESNPRHIDSGGGLQGQGPVRQSRQGGGRSGCRQNGHRDSVIYDQRCLRQCNLSSVLGQGSNCCGQKRR